jgi:hypothetical protein
MVTSMEPPRIGIDLEGPRVTADAFMAALSALVDILRDVDAQSYRVAGGTLDWVIADLSGGSAHAELAPQPKGERTPIGAGHTVARRFREGMSLIARSAERPRFFSEHGMRRALSLANLIDPNGIQSIRLRVGDEPVAVSPALARNVRDLVEGTLRAIGSVEGVLKTITVHGKPYFNVYESVSGRPIRCYVADALVDDARDNLKKRVQVRGIIRTRPDGEIASVRASEIVAFENAEMLPTVDDIRGILRSG